MEPIPKRKRFDESHFPTHNPTLMITDELILDYLKNREKYDCKIEMSYPKAVKKSYKDEKRYAFPPPMIGLSGNGWKNYKFQISQQFAKNSDFHQIELGIFSSVRFPTDSTTDNEIQVLSTKCENSNNKIFSEIAIFKQLHSRASKHFIWLQLDLKLILGPNNSIDMNFGKILSNRIKIVSKPSKKRQLQKAGDVDYLSIKSGDTVAIFNASQTNKKYMHVDENDEFCATFNKWSLFQIFLVEKDSKKIPEINTDEKFDFEIGIICYGSWIKLVHVKTKKSFPLMRIRRICGGSDGKKLKNGKNNLTANFNDGDEPVSLLHYCAFEFNQPNYGNYLGSKNENFIMEKALDFTNLKEHFINETSKWTIVTAESMEFTFAPIFNLPITKIAPIPKIERISLETKKDGYFLELNGENLHKDLIVWCGCFRTETNHRSQNVIFAKVPTWDDFNEQNKSIKIQTTSALISLIRESDGIVYPTNFYFVYSELYIGKFGKIVSKDECHLIDDIHNFDEFQDLKNHPHQPPLNNSDPAIQFLTMNANMLQKNYNEIFNQGYNFGLSIDENIYFDSNQYNCYL